MLYYMFQLKRRIEEALLLPFLLYGRWRASLEREDETFDLFCFFPSPSLGGAEKINAQLIGSFPEKRICLFFTKKGADADYASFYLYPNVTIYNISAFVDDKKRYWNNFIWRGRCSWLINRQKQSPAVLNGQCNFAYKLAPHLKKGIHYIELIHVSEKKFASITFPYIPVLPVRITGGETIIKDFLIEYRRLGVPNRYNTRWKAITYGVPFATVAQRSYKSPLKICYIGRGGPQKRLWLFFNIMRRCIELRLPLEWHLAGPFEKELPTDLLPHLQYHGILIEQDAVYSLLQQMDLMMLTSAFEGFPMVLMEAMMNGVVPISTSVGCIPEHLIQEKNGFLLHEATKEQSVVEQAVVILNSLSTSPARLSSLSKEAHQYAIRHFSNERFVAEWRNLLFPQSTVARFPE